MPTYVYKFLDTGETIEVQQSFDGRRPHRGRPPGDGDAAPGQEGLHAGGITFKGNGFYKTDSRGKSSSSSARARRRATRRPVGLVRLVELVGLRPSSTDSSDSSGSGSSSGASGSTASSDGHGHSHAHGSHSHAPLSAGSVRPA